MFSMMGLVSCCRRDGEAVSQCQWRTASSTGDLLRPQASGAAQQADGSDYPDEKGGVVGGAGGAPRQDPGRVYRQGHNGRVQGRLQPG